MQYPAARKNPGFPTGVFLFIQPNRLKQNFFTNLYFLLEIK